MKLAKDAVGHESERLPQYFLRVVTARRQAVCGGCLAHSRIVSAVSERDAWDEIRSDGWTAFDPGHGHDAYPVCPSCADKLTPKAKTLGG